MLSQQPTNGPIPPTILTSAASFEIDREVDIGTPFESIREDQEVDFQSLEMNGNTSFSVTPPPVFRPRETEDHFIESSPCPITPLRVKLSPQIIQITPFHDSSTEHMSSRRDFRDRALQSIGTQSLSVQELEHDSHRRAVDRLRRLIRHKNESKNASSSRDDGDGDGTSFSTSSSSRRRHRLKPSRTEAIVDAVNGVLRFNDSETVHVVAAAIQLLESGIFEPALSDHDDDDDDDDDGQFGDWKWKSTVSSLCAVRDRLLANNVILRQMTPILKALSSLEFEDREELFQSMALVVPMAVSMENVSVFENLLRCDDADTVDHALSELLKVEPADSRMLHDIAPLIVQCINNNKMTVKQKAVDILWAFSKDPVFQTAITDYGVSIMTVLALLNRAAFIDIAYRMVQQLAIGSAHYNDAKRQITRLLADDFDDDQYSNDDNHILALIRYENIRSSQAMLPEPVLEELILENEDSAYQYALNGEELRMVAKSRQILDFQKQSECALAVQCLFRSFRQRVAFQKERNLTLSRRQSQRESAQSMAALKEENDRQKDMICKLRSDLITLQNHVHSQKSVLIQKLNSEIATLRRRDEQRVAEMEELKERHIVDKQQFALQMMDEMNRLRDDLKRIGRLSLKTTNYQSAPMKPRSASGSGSGAPSTT